MSSPSLFQMLTHCHFNFCVLSWLLFPFVLDHITDTLLFTEKKVCLSSHPNFMAAVHRLFVLTFKLVNSSILKQTIEQAAQAKSFVGLKLGSINA